MSSIKKIWDVPKRKHFVEQNDPDIDIPDGDVVRGQKLFNEFCGGCHTLDANHWLGPPLRDVYNRKALGKKYTYSRNADMLHGVYWTRKMLNTFLENPEEIIPDTAMVFDGVRDPYDRACIIEYLHYLKVMG
jgi:Cytochrome c2